MFDKTGTLTRGEPEVTDVIAVPGETHRRVLQIAMSLEALSEHPIAAAIVARGHKEELIPHRVNQFEAVSGSGARALLNGGQFSLGNRRFMEREGIETESLADDANRLANDGKTCVLIAEGSRLIGLIGVADVPSETAKETIAMLRNMGLEVVMITGDNPNTAKAVGSALGIEHIMAEVLPEDKATEIARLRGEGHVVAMVGDGINDAPALSAADIGIAIGTGTDVAMEASDITLVRNDLKSVPMAIRLSLETMKVIRQNLFLAFIYNVIGIPIAAGALYPFFGILLNPEFAAAAMALSSVSVVSNSMRLRRAWKV